MTESQTDLDTAIGEDNGHFLDYCGWPRGQRPTVSHEYSTSTLFYNVIKVNSNIMFVLLGFSFVVCIETNLEHEICLYLFQVANRMHLAQTLLVWDLVDRRKDALEQIKKGLNTLEFMDNMCKFHVELQLLLLCRDQRQTTAKYLRDKLSSKLQALKPQNKNESNVKQYTNDLLHDLNGNKILLSIKSFKSLTCYRLETRKR